MAAPCLGYWGWIGNEVFGLQGWAGVSGLHLKPGLGLRSSVDRPHAIAVRLIVSVLFAHSRSQWCWSWCCQNWGEPSSRLLFLLPPPSALLPLLWPSFLWPLRGTSLLLSAFSRLRIQSPIHSSRTRTLQRKTQSLITRNTFSFRGLAWDLGGESKRPGSGVSWPELLLGRRRGYCSSKEREWLFRS